MKFLSIVLLVLICSCQSKKNKPAVLIKNGLFKTILERYVNVTSRKLNEEIVTIICKKNYDTSIFVIVNSFPDLKLIKFIGETKFKGMRVCIVGDLPSNLFFEIPNLGNIPQDIVKQNREHDNPANLGSIDRSEPVPWKFYFKDLRLVKYFPEKEISMACPECDIVLSH